MTETTMWRTLIRVQEVGYYDIFVVIPSWQPDTVVAIPLDQLPEGLQSLEKGDRLFAKVNTGALDRHSLRFEDFEMADREDGIMTARELRELNDKLLKWLRYENVSPNSCQWIIRDLQGNFAGELFDDCFIHKSVRIAYCFGILRPKLRENGVVAVKFKRFENEDMCTLWVRNNYSGGYIGESALAVEVACTPEIAFAKATMQLIEEKGI